MTAAGGAGDLRARALRVALVDCGPGRPARWPASPTARGPPTRRPGRSCWPARRGRGARLRRPLGRGVRARACGRWSCWSRCPRVRSEPRRLSMWRLAVGWAGELEPGDGVGWAERRTSPALRRPRRAARCSQPRSPAGHAVRPARARVRPGRRGGGARHRARLRRRRRHRLELLAWEQAARGRHAEAAARWRRRGGWAGWPG